MVASISQPYLPFITRAAKTVASANSTRHAARVQAAQRVSPTRARTSSAKRPKEAPGWDGLKPFGGEESAKTRTPSEGKLRPMNTHFKDKVVVQVTGGKGGDGCVSFEHMGAYKRKPDGGHGGAGGNVFVVTDSGQQSLSFELHHYNAGKGANGGPSGRKGKRGEDVYMRVPCGTLIKVINEPQPQGWFDPQDSGDVDSDQELEESDPEDNSEESDHEPRSESEDEEWESEAVSDSDSEGESDSNLEGYSDSEHEEDLNRDLKESQFADSATTAKPYVDNITGIPVGQRPAEGTPRRLGRKRRRSADLRTQDSGGGPQSTDPPGSLAAQFEAMVAAARKEGVGSGVKRPARREPQGGSKDVAQGKYTIIADCDKEGMTVMVAAGGRPGLGNIIQCGSRKTKGMQPRKLPGHMGESRQLELELKCIADIGLVGYPNAGKSTLLGAISMARPKVADYPFTTLSPTVGHVEYSDTHIITVADLPGLVDGAHEDRGLGFDFLRHIERTRALLYVVDTSGRDGRDPCDDLNSLFQELTLYDPLLARKPSFVLANKADLEASAQNFDRLCRQTPLKVIPASARDRTGLQAVVYNLRLMLEQSQEVNVNA